MIKRSLVRFPRELITFCHMLDSCSWINSKVARSRELLFVMFKAPDDMYDLKKTSKSDDWMLKSIGCLIANITNVIFYLTYNHHQTLVVYSRLDMSLGALS